MLQFLQCLLLMLVLICPKHPHLAGELALYLISNYLRCIQLDSCLVNYNNGSRQLTYFLSTLALALDQIKNI